MRASRRRVARIRGASVVVVAVGGRSALASAAGANFVLGARVTVVARGRVIRIDAARRRIARIVRAGVVVVAGNRRTTYARTARTGIARCARIAVAARIGVVNVLATLGHMARVVRATVAVIAIRCRTAHA